MGRIIDLPPEILGQIFEEETTDSAKHNRSLFVRLLRVNHLFYNIVTPMLYKKLSTDGFVYDGMWETGLWARTLLEDETKIPLVQSVEICTNSMYRRYTPPREERLDPLSDLNSFGSQRLHAIVASVFEEADDDRSRFTKLGCEEHRIECVLAIILIRLTALRIVRIRRRSDLLWDCLQAVSNSLSSRAGNARSRYPFEALRTVKIDSSYNGERWPHPPTALGIAAGWQRVQNLVVESTGDQPDDAEVALAFDKLKAKSTDLRVLLLGHCSELHIEHLVRLLGTPKALEIFYYHVGAFSERGVIPFGITGIFPAISQQQASLRHVSLQVRSPSEGRGMPCGGMNFRDFMKLETLQIQFGLFVGTRDNIDRQDACEHIIAAVPFSLEVLSIVQCVLESEVEITMDAFDALAHRKDDQTPSLHTLRISIDSDPITDEEQLRKFASKSYEAVGGATRRNPRIDLLDNMVSCHSGIQLLPWGLPPNFEYQEVFHGNAWRRSGVYTYLSDMCCDGLDDVLSGHE